MSEALKAAGQKAAIESVLGNIDIVDKTLYWRLVYRIEVLEAEIEKLEAEVERFRRNDGLLERIIDDQKETIVALQDLLKDKSYIREKVALWDRQALSREQP